MNDFWLGFLIGLPVWGTVSILIFALVIGGKEK